LPFVAVPVDLPEQVVELRAGDVDADGVDELVALSAKRRGTKPDAVSFTVMGFEPTGRVSDRWTADVQNRALFVDIQSGFWAVGADGLVALESTGPRTVVEMRTPLSGVGMSRAQMTDVFVDLEDDGTAEAVIAMGGTIRIVGVDGKERAKVNARSRGELSSRRSMGNQLVVSSVSPAWKIDDFDGDGFRDLLLPDGEWLTVYHLNAEGMRTRKSIKLPLNVSARPEDDPNKRSAVEKEVQAVWFEDVNGDGKTDFVAQLWVSEGSWFGAVGEVVFAPGTGTGFGPAQRLSSDEAVMAVNLVDLNGDGRKELCTFHVDLGVGTLARALVSKQVKIQMYARSLSGARFGPATPLHTVVRPVESRQESAFEFEHDVTGDGLPDLVTKDEDGGLAVFSGKGKGFSDTPIRTAQGALKGEETRIWVGDLTGDSQAEIVVWKTKTKRAQLLMFKP